MITTITFKLDHNDQTLDVASALHALRPEHFAPGRALRGCTAFEWLGLAIGQCPNIEECTTIERTPGWAAGWNIPGCLPDEEPQTFKEFADACLYLMQELTSHADELRAQAHQKGGNEMIHLNHLVKQHDEAVAQVQQLRTNVAGETGGFGPFWLKVGNHAWWVAREQ